MENKVKNAMNLAGCANQSGRDLKARDESWLQARMLCNGGEQQLTSRKTCRAVTGRESACNCSCLRDPGRVCR